MSLFRRDSRLEADNRKPAAKQSAAKPKRRALKPLSLDDLHAVVGGYRPIP